MRRLSQSLAHVSWILLLAIAAASVGSTVAAAQPNVLVIYADDKYDAI